MCTAIENNITYEVDVLVETILGFDLMSEPEHVGLWDLSLGRKLSAQHLNRVRMSKSELVHYLE